MPYPILIGFLILTAYLFGSVCSAIIICKLFGLPDPRQHGSNNPGATNVLRLAGKKYALLVLFLDMLKGFLPVLLGRLLDVDTTLLSFIALFSILGHVYPVFFQFQGGKGVATTLGALLGFKLFLGLGVVFTWLLVAGITRYSSLSSLIAITLAPIYTWFVTGNLGASLGIALISVIIIMQHRKNIGRLLQGKEPKIGAS